MTDMTPAASHVLSVACHRYGLTPEGWEHFFTGTDDDGVGAFLYANRESTLRVSTSNGQMEAMLRELCPACTGRGNDDCQACHGRGIREVLFP